MDERVALVGLLRGPFSGSPARLRQLLLEGAIPSELLTVPDAYDASEREMADWESRKLRLVTYLDVNYPQQLREVHDFPLVVFIRGEERQNDCGVCVVGSRDVGQLEVDAAAEISRILVNNSFTVVSGLARGIDSAAHSEALRLGGRTVGVIGTGIDKYAPASSKPLQLEMEQKGLILSQFWPGFAGNKAAFPMRNAVMSAYGRCTIIVSASEKSGTRHQAKQALRHGRPLVLSRSVATGTSWGREYSANRSNDIEVAASAREAAEMAMNLATRRLEALFNA